jgi:hypothetical protein
MRVELRGRTRIFCNHHKLNFLYAEVKQSSAMKYILQYTFIPRSARNPSPLTSRKVQVNGIDSEGTTEGYRQTRVSFAYGRVTWTRARCRGLFCALSTSSLPFPICGSESVYISGGIGQQMNQNVMKLQILFDCIAWKFGPIHKVITSTQPNDF